MNEFSIRGSLHVAPAAGRSVRIGVQIANELLRARVVRTLAVSQIVELWDESALEVDVVVAAQPVSTIVARPVILLVTSDIGDEALLVAVASGVRAIVFHDHSLDDLNAAVAAVCDGKSWVSSTTGGRLMSLMAASRLAEPVQCDVASLTRREREVLRCMADGQSNSEIAALLFVTVRTVKHHVSNVLAKLGARDRAHAVSLALRSAGSFAR